MSVPPRSTERPAPGDKVGRADLAVRALKRLAAAHQAAKLYHVDASTSEPVRQFLEFHTRYAERFGPLTVEVTRSSFILDGERTECKNDVITPLAESLHSRWIRRLSVLPGVPPREVGHLLTILATPRETVRIAGGADHILDGFRVERIVLHVTAAPPDEPGAGGRAADRLAAATAILRLFVAASKNIRLYSAGHRAVETSVEALGAALAPVLARDGSIQYDARDGSVVCGQDPLEMDPRLAGEFAAACAARRIGGVAIRRGVTREELTQAVSLFASDPETLIVEGGFPEALVARKVTHVSTAPLQAPEGNTVR